MKKIIAGITLLILFSGKVLFATEGMWLPQLLSVLNEKEMKEMGMKITAKDIYDVSRGSLKDAIVSLGGFCTAEVISDKGLLLTNHHCAYSAIQQHSSLQNNYIDNGFWAFSASEELANPGLTATFIIRIDEVTQQALEGVTGDLTERERQSRIDKNLNAVRASAQKESWQHMLIRPFFEGNKYYLFITETFTDVRLVGTPPSSIGKFGSDTDNWVWPRHTGDFALFRIYADKNNRPAEYSKENVPYKPKRSLSISLDGLNRNDFTMVFGFPGRTQEYLHSAAIAQVLEKQNPAKIEIRTRALNITDKYMRGNEAIKIQYASKFASTANAWKKWQGESLGLEKTRAVAKRKAYEADFQKRVDANPEWKKLYGTLLQDLADTYTAIENPALYRDIFNETMRNVEILSFGTRVIPLINASSRSADAYEDIKTELLEYSKDYFKNYSKETDREVAVALLNLFVSTMPQSFVPATLQADNSALVTSLFNSSLLVHPDNFTATLQKPMDDAVATLSSDPAVQLVSSMARLYSENNVATVNTLQEKLNGLQQKYMEAQLTVFKEKRFYPDANSTMRVTYGKVNGYSPRDAVEYDHYTYLDGVMEKYVPGDYEFDVPAKLIELYNKKDYGPYGVNGKMPVCFIASNHTTGGNSGSPALDAWGNLVGLNFDRVWEGTMSDINYDPSICRNIMVDARYILFIIDKFAGAGHLVREMKLVHPKKQGK
ncbi:MAG: S46 family peptidase [Chitinophagaceae bacterium]|nr:S46 family peptidase [Chitinophagaceae bacterium]MCW5925929.1 S46 family peptidase [Chitinophagaceae bacterium]